MARPGEGPAQRSGPTAVRAGVDAALARRGVAELLLVAFTVLVYRDAYWSVPRWDHLVYLYEASRFATGWELLAHAPAWNRAVSIGDHVEFRPLFHLMLGAEQVLLGRAYTAWQAVGIALHAGLAILLLRLGRRAFRGIWPPLLLSALFASALLAAETVVWFHANAYILCSALLVASLERLLAFLETGRAACARACLALALPAAFTYELGPIYCAVAGALLVISALAPAAPGRGASSRPIAPRRARLAIGGAHLLVTSIYLAASYADLVWRFGGIGGSDLRLPRPADLALGAEFAVRQVGFWLGGLALPGLYDIAPGARATFLGLVSPPGPGAVVGAAAALLCLAAGAGVARGALSGAAPGLAAAMAFLGAYSLVVALGRSVPRGLAYTLEQNLQHAYPAVLAGIVGIILAAWTWRRSTADPFPGRVAPRLALLALGVGGVGLVCANAVATTALLAEFRHSYDAPRLELLEQVGRWHEKPGRARFFTVAADCPGRDALSWFALYTPPGSPAVSLADVIFPATSYALHRARLPSATPADQISCADGDIQPEALEGRWREGPRTARIGRDGVGRLEAVNPDGSRSPLIVQGRVVLAPAWRARGLVSHDERYLFWSGAIPWHR